MSDDLRPLIADLREAARFVATDPDGSIARVHRARSALRPRPLTVDQATSGHLGARLEANLSAGLRVARSNPGMLAGYLRGAADELEMMADRRRGEGLGRGEGRGARDFGRDEGRGTRDEEEEGEDEIPILSSSPLAPNPSPLTPRPYRGPRPYEAPRPYRIGGGRSGAMAEGCGEPRGVDRRRLGVAVEAIMRHGLDLSRLAERVEAHGRRLGAIEGSRSSEPDDEDSGIDDRDAGRAARKRQAAALAAVDGIPTEALEAGVVAEMRAVLAEAAARLQPFVGEGGGYQMCRPCEAEQYGGLPIIHRDGCVAIRINDVLTRLETPKP